MGNKLQFLKGTGALPIDRVANNIYFKLGTPGEGQIALGENIWNESVQIKDGDNVLAYSAADGLSASVSLSYDVEGKKIKLVGKEGANLGEIDATAFLKDGMLESASFENNKLIFVFNTDAGKTQIEVPVSDLVDEYTAGNGLALSGKEFSVKVTGESFLSVDGEGVKLSGVQSAINDAKAAAISEANVASAAAKAAADAAQKDVDALEQNVKGIDDDLTALEGVVNDHVADAVAHITADERNAWNAAEQNAKDYADGKFQVKGNYEASGAAADALASAKAYADGVAADAESNAKAYAKEYADGLNKAMDSRVDELEAKKHEHANKTTLDAITAEKVADWDDAVGKEHVHSNKEVLDSITAEKVSNWDGSLASAKEYADGVAANAKDSAIADAATKYQAKGNYEAAGAAAAAESNAKAYAKEYADGVAADALVSAKEYADGVAADAQSAAEQNANDYADGLKTTIDAYTVNGKAISANPVLNGGEIKLDGFAAVSQASAVVASDTINSAIAKLEKSIADVSAAAVKLGTQEGNVVLTIDEATKGLSAHLEWGEF